MSQREVQWERMFPDELEAAFEACPVVYLPYGLCEPHGWHNAVGMDAIRAHQCSCQSARTHGGIVAPPFYWHCHESGGYGTWAYNDAGVMRWQWHSDHLPIQARFTHAIVVDTPKRWVIGTEAGVLICEDAGQTKR